MMQFAEMLKIETSGTKFKYGTELPNVITEWLEEDFHEAFLLIKGQNYDKDLKNKITILGLKLYNCACFTQQVVGLLSLTSLRGTCTKNLACVLCVCWFVSAGASEPMDQWAI